MKRILFVLVTLLALSCVKDPWQEINKGGWNHEHSILSIKLEGQVGETVIENLDMTNGTVSLELVPYIISDMSAVKIESMELSLNAQSNLSVGATLDFSNGNNPSMEVVSESGEKRVYVFTAEEFTESLLGCYKINGSMVLGGTGHDYGGAGLMSPESKSWCWDDNGFGPKAEYDDYLEFTLDEFTSEGNTRGKLVHYAGVDGKFWNCVFAAKQNKEGNAPIDLHKYYRNIPIGISTWERNYAEGTISFTDSEGKVTVSKLFDAGDYTVLEERGQGKAKVLSVENQAFAFSIQGVDDWTNIYGDYDKFAKKAIAHFVLVEKVEDIPAESKTEGTEGEINLDPPPPPAPAENLAGTYKLDKHIIFTVEPNATKGNFMSPQDKSWDWNNVAKEKDNTLILTPTSTTAEGYEIGEADYTPGTDGEYWDYTLLAKYCVHNGKTENEDLTQLYGWLPHGKSSYVYNQADGIITFTAGDYSVSVKFLKYGTYTYTFKTFSKELVLEGNMAFDFAMPKEYEEAFSAVPVTWTDGDWMLYFVKNYIMCFTKVE